MSSGLKEGEEDHDKYELLRKISILSLNLTICPRVHAATEPFSTA